MAYISPNPFERLIQNFLPGARLLKTWPLTGGVSATVTALQVQHPDGQIQKVVVRQHGEQDRLNNPQVAAHEFRLLQILQTASVAAPKPLYLDSPGDMLGSPCMVIEFIDGEPDFAPSNLDSFLQQMAAELAKIHHISQPPTNLGFLPTQADRYATTLTHPPAQLDQSLSEGAIRSTLAAAWPWPQTASTLLHGDFWPGNLLWQAGQLQAVIDWEDALVGDPLADLGNARLELLWAFGEEAAQVFTELYTSLTGADLSTSPYYDLYAALRPASKLGTWGLEPVVEARLRTQHRAFVTQAFQALGLSLK